MYGGFWRLGFVRRMKNELADLSLEDEEDEVLMVRNGNVPSQVLQSLCLVGCLLTACIVHFPTMKSTLANLWHLVKGVELSNLRETRFLFKFVS